MNNVCAAGRYDEKLLTTKIGFSENLRETVFPQITRLTQMKYSGNIYKQ